MGVLRDEQLAVRPQGPEVQVVPLRGAAQRCAADLDPSDGPLLVVERTPVPRFEVGPDAPRYQVAAPYHPGLFGLSPDPDEPVHRRLG